ncbi:hypothetical protein FACS1894176_08610 [Bacteroidia bacterium]|nr:hypothetical protein FACS1894176_08610 [Bacteroidia bacterium]
MMDLIHKYDWVIIMLAVLSIIIIALDLLIKGIKDGRTLFLPKTRLRVLIHR